MNIKMKIIALWMMLFSIKMPINAGDVEVIYKLERNWKSFYIMKVIYNSIIYRALTKNVRDVQQSLYMEKPKYILKI